MHHREYGEFVGKVINYSEGIDYLTEWEVLVEGKGAHPVTLGNRPNTTGTEDFEDITDIYSTPLFQALL